MADLQILDPYTGGGTARSKQNVLTGSQTARFKSIDLHQYLSVITDSRGPRVVVHEFPNRDGGKVETLGRKPHKTSWQLTFTGPDWLSTFLNLAQSIDDDPSGLLVHPVYGQMQVVCEGLPRTVINLPEATDTISVEISFVEDQLDLGIVAQQSLATKQQAVSTSVTSFQISTASYTDSATSTANTNLTAAATTYAAAAFAAGSSNIVDPSLQSLLDAVAQSTAAAELAIMSSPFALTSVAQTYDALAGAEVIYASCLDLADEVALQTSSYVSYVVPGLISIGALAQSIYGSDAISKIDQLLTLNSIANPSAIPAGTILILPPK